MLIVWLGYLLARALLLPELDIPLLEAINQGDGSAVRRLLDAGANPNASGGPNESALSLARRRSDKEVVKMLLKAGATD